MTTENLTQLTKNVLIQLGADNPLPERLTDYDGELYDWTRSAVDAANHGADGGFSGFTYYDETVEFACLNWDLITKSLTDQAKELGCNTVSEMVSGFNRSKWSAFEVERLLVECAPIVEEAVRSARNSLEYFPQDHMLLLNLLAWYALEEAGREVEGLLD